MSDVRVCGRCGEPMVFTFEFPGYEYVCMACSNKEGIFGARVPNTPEVEKHHGELVELYYRDRAHRRREPEPEPWPRQGEAESDVQCAGCGRLPAIGTPLGEGKPPAWFSRTQGGVTVYACSKPCTDDKASVLPW